MGFRIFCDQKGCRKEMEPALDKTDNKVYCTECGKEIHCVTEFAKNQMVSLGMVKRESKRQQAFSVRCNKCNKENPPTLKKDRLHCAHCDAEIEGLSAPFALAIKEFLRAQGNRG
jgi:ribosomal protein L34E